MRNNFQKTTLLSNLIRVCILIALTCTFGCEKKPAANDDSQTISAEIPDALTLLIVGEPEIGARIKRQWSARRDGQVKVLNQSVAEFEAADFAIAEDVDIVIYPPTMIGELVSRKRLREMPGDFLDSEEYNRAELLRHYRTSVVRQRNESWAVPLGGSNFALLCNREAFKDIKPLEFWEQVDRTLEKLGKTEFVSGNDNLEAKIDMPLGKGWAAHTFLARVAPSICHRGILSTVLDRQSMKPLIATEPFVEALDQLKAIASSRSLDSDPQAIYQLASSGESALAMGWPALGFENQESDGGNGQASGSTSNRNQDRLTIKSLPGMPKWFDQKSKSWIKRGDEDEARVDTIGFSGLVASVSVSSRNDRWSWIFLKWLPSKTISKMILVESPNVGPFRASHLGDASRWTGELISLDVADEYADVVAAAHERTQTLMFPRIPGYRQYIAALDEAVRSAVAGEKTSQAALDEVAVKWEQLTESLGRAKQISAIKKESGL